MLRKTAVVWSARRTIPVYKERENTSNDCNKCIEINSFIRDDGIYFHKLFHVESF